MRLQVAPRLIWRGVGQNADRLCTGNRDAGRLDARCQRQILAISAGGIEWTRREISIATPWRDWNACRGLCKVKQGYGHTANAAYSRYFRLSLDP